MKQVQLILGTYNYQPDGDFPHIYERAYQKAYKPFLSVLNDFPDFPCVLHYSGFLLEWMEEHHPEFLMLLKEMVDRKQVELLGGGFYEPILTLIPDADKLGQIEKMTTYLRARFGTRPRGSWIAERIWEPVLAKILRNSGMDYTFLDDRYFHIAGVNVENSYLPYLTEDQGKTISVFPINLTLQEMVCRRSPEEVLKRLIDLADDSGKRVISIIIQGEKLDDHEESFKRCYHEDWFKNFFKAISGNRERIEPVTPRVYLKKTPPLGKIYFPCLVHKEMMKWVLSKERQKYFKALGRKLKRADMEHFLRGGYFRQFLTKYPEINLLYARMMYTHILVNQIRGDKYKKQAARTELWKGQSNAVYWHGRTCGIYSNHLRKMVYRSFIEAERITRSSLMFMPSIIKTDFDMDGHQEYLYQGSMMNAYVHTVGGAVIELDFLPVSWNYLDTMSRWPEPCHQKKSEGCDWYPRKCFLDHFFAPSTDIDSFDRMEYTELGDFIDQPFEPVELKRDQKELILERNGRLIIKKKHYPVRIRKQYIFHESSIDLHLALINLSEKVLDIWYGLELNLALASKGRDSVRLFGMRGKSRVALGNDKCQAEKLGSYHVKDMLNKVMISLSSVAVFNLWCLPVETLSQSILGMDRIYQSSCFIPHWNFRLKGGDLWETRLCLKLEKV